MLRAGVCVSVFCARHFIFKTVVGVDLHPERGADLVLDVGVQKALSLNPNILVLVVGCQLLIQLGVLLWL